MYAKDRPEVLDGQRMRPSPTRQTTAEEQAAARTVSAQITSLQRAVGNAAVTRMVTRRTMPGPAVQRQIFFEFDPVSNILEFQHNTSVRPAWEGTAATMATNAAAQGQTLNHIIPFERIERDLTKHLNFLLEAQNTQNWGTRVADFEANCDALFTNGSAEHTTMVGRRDSVRNLIRNLAANPTGGQRSAVTSAARNLLRALNSSSQNLRAGNASLNASISNAIDADFRPGTFWYSGPVITDSTPPAGGNPPANATRITGPAGAQGNHSVTDIECVRLTQQHESHVFPYIEASPSSFHFIVSGGAGALHPLAQPGQQMSSTLAPTAVAVPNRPLHPVIVMDPNNTRAPHLFSE